MARTAHRLSLVVVTLAVLVLGGCVARKRPTAPPPTAGKAMLARAPITTGELSDPVNQCWLFLKICDLDGRIVEGGGTWTPAVRNLWDGLEVSPGPHRFRVETGDVCDTESRAGSYVAGALAAGVVGAISAATYEAPCPPTVLEFTAEAGKTYFVEPIDKAAPHAPWVRMRTE